LRETQGTRTTQRICKGGLFKLLVRVVLIRGDPGSKIEVQSRSMAGMTGSWKWPG
jgi:hypothetical protein